MSELSNLEIKGISLVSLEEAKEMPLNIRRMGEWWWLGTPGAGTSFICAICHDGSLSVPGVAASANYLRIRPVLDVACNEIESLDKYQEVEYLGESWIVLSSSRLMKKSFAGQHNFNDNEAEITSNLYENSSLQKYLNAWLEEKQIESKKQDNTPDSCECRLGKVGGQAVLEGVMMRSGNQVALAVRKSDGSIVIDRSEFVSVRKKYKILNGPILRGITNFVEMLILSYRTLMKSADMLGIEEEMVDENASEEVQEKQKEKASKAMKVTEVFSAFLGVLLAVGLFIVAPVYGAKLINYLTPSVDLDSLFAVTSLIEGAIRIVIFLTYLLLVSLIADMRRTFEFHGGEHKSVFCYEFGKPLNAVEAAKCSRFHPRCGTSFIFVILIISILVGALIPGSLPKLARIGCKFLLVPLIVGIGYEFIFYAGRHNNALVRFLSAPGLWMQRITTKEPDEKQLEVAIAALKAAIPEDFPEMIDVVEVRPDGTLVKENENDTEAN